MLELNHILWMEYMAGFCNIDQSDRINRTVIGAIILLAAIFGASQLFFIIVGLVMIIQGIVGWCSLPLFMDIFRKKK